jgi:pimeloyl-ACP methyl ester carboxylesterase
MSEPGQRQAMNVARRTFLRAAAASAALTSTALAQGPRSPFSFRRVRRSFLDSRYGQLHVRTVAPDIPTAAPPLVCLHQAPLSGRMFGRFLAEMGRDRSAMAPDLPGYGESDPPTQAPEVADYADAIVDLVERLGSAHADVLGIQAGAAVAVELALRHPKKIRRVALCSVPLHTKERRDALLLGLKPNPPTEDGAHLMRLWQAAFAGRGPGQTLEMVAASIAERLRAGDAENWALQSVYRWDGFARLPLVTQPTLVLRPKDPLWEPTGAVSSLMKSARPVELPDMGNGLFGVDPARLASLVRGFLY